MVQMCILYPVNGLLVDFVIIRLVVLVHLRTELSTEHHLVVSFINWQGGYGQTWVLFVKTTSGGSYQAKEGSLQGFAGDS